MSSAIVLRTVEAALGAPLTKLFASFEEAPLAAATSISISISISTPATALRSVSWRNLQCGLATGVLMVLAIANHSH